MAKAGGAELAVFSELCLCGYPPQDLIERPVVCRAQSKGTCTAWPSKSRCRRSWASSARRRTTPGKPVANSAALIARRQNPLRAAQNAAAHLRRLRRDAATSSPRTRRMCSRWAPTRSASRSARTAGTTRTSGSKRLYERDPVAELAGKGSSLLLNISSSPYTLGKRGFRLDMLRATARQHGQPFVYVNQVGGNDSLVFRWLERRVSAETARSARSRNHSKKISCSSTR